MTGVAMTILQVAATLASCNLYFSLTPELRRVHSEKSISTMPLLPILSMLASATCWVLYGCVAGDVFPVAVTNIVGVALSLGYVIVYFRNAAELKSRVLRQVAILLAVILAVVCYCVWCPFSHHCLKLQTGYLACVISALLFASPLVVLKRVMAEKNSVYLPRTMVFSGLLNSLLWSVDGILVSDMFVASPNFINGVLGLLQLALIVIYPKRSTDMTELDMETAEQLHCVSLVVVVSPIPEAQFVSIKSPV